MAKHEYDRLATQLLEASRYGRISLRDFERIAPRIARQLRIDAESSVFEYWANSYNHDEFENKRIVDLKILNVIGRLANYPIRSNQQFHAGLMHTYGYLFSQLKTRYGYKRDRWVSGEIETGLGLPAGSLLPKRDGRGTLLQNVTFLLGQIVFTQRQRKRMAESLPAVHEKIVGLDIRNFDQFRLQESFSIGKTNHFVNSDLVKFERSTRKRHSLLIYSHGEASKPDFVKLVTCFPVDEPSVELALSSAKELKPIIRARYNIAVNGFTREGKCGGRKLIKKRK